MKKTLFIVAGILSLTATNAQVSFGKMQNQIPRSKDGLNVFDVKKNDVPFEGLSVDLGGALAMQFQALNSFNDQTEGTYIASNGAAISGNAGTTGYRLNKLQNNFNLPAANLVF